MKNLQRLFKKLIKAEELTAMIRKDFICEAKKETKHVSSDDLFGDDLFDD